ncbi:hypothetical protein VARIO8X_110100 [Burkholderiales bacterium 8X]|nr:hypothetical protein VARIO8X_110100 [Burkholderiales bacterium 8X]
MKASTLLTSKHDGWIEPAEPPLAGSIVAEVLYTLQIQFGARRFADLLAGEPIEKVIEVWARYLGGMRREELSRGLQNTARQRYVPTLGEFAVLCRPCLDPEYAWVEAQAGLAERAQGRTGEWTHPAVWRAATSMWQEITTGDQRRHRVHWSFRLRRELAQGWGEPVPSPLHVLEAPAEQSFSLPGSPPHLAAKEVLKRLKEEDARKSCAYANGVRL